jgi:hypothetical protein
MTPKEKAIHLYNKFRNENSVMSANIRAKKQALICVEEIIAELVYDKQFEYWQEVKQEIEKL